ncbi:arginine--tRNA ligase, partial [Candidatus Curtissbacteria bacterium]|nr:arginine--tRNA ligase [Candidatus Curtissbacteria bacterium]
NHHGHVPRLKAAVGALGFDASAFRVILYQWVRFLKGKEVAKMSKRAGTLLTAGEVLKEVGVDAVRFFILSYDPNSPIDFDLDLAKERSAKNPVYYVQYAHARTASILTKAEGLKSNVKINYKLLNTDYELGLIKQISRLPELVEEIASSFAVHRLTAYAIDLADAFHKFYENCRVLDEKEELKNARLALIKATQTALKNTLDLLGISAPKKM